MKSCLVPSRTSGSKLRSVEELIAKEVIKPLIFSVAFFIMYTLNKTEFSNDDYPRKN